MLRTLKCQRTKLQQKIKAQLMEAEALLSSKQQNLDSDNKVTEVEVSLSMLNRLKVRFQETATKISEFSDDRTDEELEIDSEIYVDLTTDIDLMSSRLSCVFAQLTKQTSQTTTVESSSNIVMIQQKIDKLVELEALRASSLDESRACATPSMVTGSFVRLPKLEFEKFSGDVLRYKEFWDSFDAAIHSNSRLQPVEKLNYLRAYLSGDAKEVISGVSTCDENYDVAVQLLQKRFGNTQATIDTHYSRIANLQPVPNYIPKIRSLVDQIEKHLRCLAALGEDIEHRHFISLIMSKLPREAIIRLEESKQDEEDWTVDLLRRKLESFINAREAADRQRCSSVTYNVSNDPTSRRLSSFGTKSMNSHDNWSRRKHQLHSTSETLVTSDRLQTKTNDTRCSLCKGEHYTDECRKYRSLEERRRCLHGRCFVCLKNGHLAPECPSTKPYFYCKKIKWHHRCLCPSKYGKPVNTSNISVEDNTSTVCSKTNGEAGSEVGILSSGEKVLLQTATVRVRNPQSSVCFSTRVLLDCGSNRSYISKSLADNLKIQSTGKESFSVVTFGSDKPKTVNTKIAQLEVLLRDGSSKCLDVNIIPQITGTVRRSPVEVDLSSQLWKDFPLADSLPVETESTSVEFLIGSDYYLDLVQPTKVQIAPGLYLLGSEFGWLLSGRVEGRQQYDQSNVSMFVSSLVNQNMPALSNLVKVDENFPVKPSFEDMWKLESIGITDNPNVKDDDRALIQFNSNVKMVDGRYEVCWPWKDDCANLPTNYQLSVGRVKSLMRKLQGDRDLLRKYAEIIDDQERKGIIEKVTTDMEGTSVKHYIPHHPVVNNLKATTKVRIVYDASAKVNKASKSLNECLLRGPVILEDLCGLLLRFRTFPVVLLADIEKAFLQIGIQSIDRDVIRFIWLKNPSTASVENNLQVYRFCRVPFGVISSPFLLCATIKYHLQQFDSSTARKISQSLYVDNVVTGVKTTTDAVYFYKEAKKMFATAAMNLREWNSNDATFLASITEIDKSTQQYTKVLGIPWDKSKDVLMVHIASTEKMKLSSTKRQFLQSLASIFDPLGFFSPITVKAKIFIHRLWSQSLDWDERVSDSQKSDWLAIILDLTKIQNHCIPRLVTIATKRVQHFDLLCFCDASELVYCTVVYLRASSEDSAQVSQMFSKTRLAPRKRASIPRLELLAVVIGLRSLKFVEQQLRLQLDSKIIWTDSQCVLHWLSSKKPQPVFIENRLREIRKDDDIDFRYVKTTENPADLATRDKLSYEQLQTSNWWKGPDWLCEAKAN